MKRREPPRKLRQPDEGNMPLGEFLKLYCMERDVSTAYGYNMRLAVGQIQRFAERRLRVRDLTSELVNDFIQSLLEKGRVKSTAKYQVGIWRGLMKAGHERGWCEPPEHLRRVKLPQPNPKAWTRAEFEKLLAACQQAKGMVPRTRLTRANYWTSFLLVAYDTGMRLADLVALKPGDISDEGLVSVVQSKTGRTICRELQPLTLEYVARTLAEERREVIWPMPMNRSHWSRDFQAIVWQAGLTGSLKRIRKTAVMLVELERPGMARHFLGHSTDSMWRHYVDMGQVGADVPPPPSVGESQPMPSPKGGKRKRARPIRYSVMDRLDARRSEIEAWIAAGECKKDMARRLQVSRDAFYQWLARRGIVESVRRRPPPDEQGMRLLDRHILDIRRMLVEGKSQRAIAKEIGCHRDTLRLWLIRRGFLRKDTDPGNGPESAS